mgnify:CR=1 FL=1
MSPRLGVWLVLSLLGLAYAILVYRRREMRVRGWPWMAGLRAAAISTVLLLLMDLELPGTKMVIGDGPALAGLRNNYPDVRFTGFKKGTELASLLASSSVFVFPSLTDTLGWGGTASTSGSSVTATIPARSCAIFVP